MLAKHKFQHLHRLHAQLGRALESLLELGPLVGQITLLLVRVFESLSHLAHLAIQLTDLFLDLEDLGVWLLAGVEADLAWSFTFIL